MNYPGFAVCRRTRDMQLFPKLEKTPDINRGEQRFAAEVALAEFRGDSLPGMAVRRALITLEVLARG